jgi:acylphosphatase
VVAAGGMPDQSSGSVIASIQVFYEGNVQGVGFRYFLRQIAKGFDITGSVRNLRDGRVELLATGEEDEVRAFIEAIWQSELRAHIKKHSETPLVNPPIFRGFEIRHD